MLMQTVLVAAMACLSMGMVVPHISDQINNMKLTWTAKNNDAIQHRLHLGTAKDAREVTRRELPQLSKLANVAQFDAPAEFDVRTQWPACVNVFNNIRNQAQCGSCWAVAAASVFSDRKCIMSKGAVQTSYSGLDTLACCKGMCGNGCEGGYPSRAWEWYVRTGVVTGGSFTNRTGCQPYYWTMDGNAYCSPEATSDCPTAQCSNQCQQTSQLQYQNDKRKADSAFSVPQSQSEIMAHLMQDGSLEAAFDVYNDFFSYSSGVYQRSPNAQYAGGHAVRVIGWGSENGTPYWMVANSWGTDWGLSGFFKILRGADECGIEEAMCAGMVNGNA